MPPPRTPDARYRGQMLSYPEYLAHVDADSHLLAAAAVRGLDVDVPCCPGWSVLDLLDHVSRVYSSRIDIVEQELVDRWPLRRPRPAEADPLEWFRAEAARLIAVLAAADPAAPAKSFARKQTVGFWIRRMAHETVIHRIDAEQSHGYESAIDPALALDGIAELFDVFITRQSDRNELAAGETAIEVAAGEHSWIARLGRLTDRTGDRVEEYPIVVLDPAATADARFSGDPVRMFLWMWGRAPLADISVDGPVELAHRFREVCSI